MVTESFEEESHHEQEGDWLQKKEICEWRTNDACYHLSSMVELWMLHDSFPFFLNVISPVNVINRREFKQKHLLQFCCFR